MPDYAAKDALERLDQDLDAREELIREIVLERMEELPKPELTDSVIATYFVVSDGKRVYEVGQTIAYHQTTAIKHPEPGSLVGLLSGLFHGTRSSLEAAIPQEVAARSVVYLWPAMPLIILTNPLLEQAVTLTAPQED